jgi:hypothetical protein
MNEITVIEGKVNPMVAKAQALEIKDNPQYFTATDFLKGIKALEKEVEDTFDPIIEKSHLAHKEALSQKDKYFKPLVNAERLIKSKIGEFLVIEERKRKEAEDKLRREADKKREELERKAEEAAANGKESKAEQYQEKANNVVAPTLAPTVEKVEGISFRENWYAEVTDINLLPKTYMLPDMVKLNKFAKAMKDSVAVPGVTFKCEKIVSSSAR